MIVSGPRAQHKPRESVNPVSTSDHQELTIKACEDDNQGSLGFNDLKEDQKQESDDEMIFTYVHKMFRTKERKWVGSTNTADSAASAVEADLLEGELRGAFSLNRQVLS